MFPMPRNTFEAKSHDPKEKSVARIVRKTDDSCDAFVFSDHDPLRNHNVSHLQVEQYFEKRVAPIVHFSYDQ